MRKLCIMGVALLMCAMTVRAQEVQPSFPCKGTLTGDKVALHSRPTVNSESLDYLRKGQELTVLEARGDWLRVQALPNLLLWVDSQAVGKDGVVLRDTVMYVGPSSIFSDVGTLKGGETVIPANGRATDGFVTIHAPEQARVWILGRYVKLLPARVEASRTAADAAKADTLKKDIDARLTEESANLEADRKRLTALEDDAARMRREHEEMVRSLEQLRHETAMLERQKEEASLKAAQVRAEREAEAAKAREQLKRLEEENRVMAEESARAEGAKTQMAEATRAKQLEVEVARAELMKLEIQAKTERARLESEDKARKAALAEAVKRVQEAEEANGKLQERQAQLEKSRQQMVEASKAAETLVETLKQERGKLEAAKIIEEANLADIRAEVEKLSASKTALRAEAEKTHKELEQLGADAKKAAESLAAARAARAAEAKAAQEAADAEAAAAAEAIAAATGKAEAARKALTAAQEELAAAQKAAEETAAATAKLREERERLEAERKAEMERLEAEKKAAAARREAERREAEERRAAEEEMISKMEPDLAPVSLKSGILKALDNGGNAAATHALCDCVNQGYVVVCYVLSPNMDLSRWENLDVTIEGEMREHKGWSRPVIVVKSIMRKR